MTLVRGGGAVGSGHDRRIEPLSAPSQAPFQEQIQQQHSVALGAQAPVLPHGWQAATDSQGRTYYIDHSTRQTHWTLPGTSTLLQTAPPHYAAPPNCFAQPMTTSYGVPPVHAPVPVSGAFVAGAPPLQALPQSSLAHSMSSMSVSDGPTLPPCQPDNALREIEKMVAIALKRTPSNLNSSPGAAILVIAGGHTIVRHCWGQENVETGRPVTEHTVFDLASLSKQFTALAVVRLVGEGRVILTAPLSTYVADFAPIPKSKTTSAWSQINVQHLLHHTSGTRFWLTHTYTHQCTHDTHMHLRVFPVVNLLPRFARLYRGGLGRRRSVPKFDTRRTATGEHVTHDTCSGVMSRDSGPTPQSGSANAPSLARSTSTTTRATGCWPCSCSV